MILMKFTYKTLFSAAVSLFVGGSAMAQSANLTMKWKSDYQYDIKQDFVMDMTMPNPMGEGNMETKMKMVMGMGGASSGHDLGTLVNMKFDTITMNMSMGGNEVMSYDSSKPDPENPLSKAMRPLLDLDFNTLYGKNGAFIELQDFKVDVLKPEMGITKESLESMMKQQSQMLPDREVKVGEVWKSQIIAPLQGFEDGLICNYTFKLASVKDEEGKEIAKIDYSADMEKMKMKQAGMEMVMDAKNIEGYYLFDVADGQFTESKTFFDMVAEVQGQEMLMQMDIKLDFNNSPVAK